MPKTNWIQVWLSAEGAGSSRLPDEVVEQVREQSTTFASVPVSALVVHVAVPEPTAAPREVTAAPTSTVG